MSNRISDEQVREKMVSLDTLSGGIVYGHDEAWEKLQARMDKKPVKKIAVKYWMAAAALLLLLVSVGGIVYYPAQYGVVINDTVKDKKTNEVAVTPQVSPAIQAHNAPLEKVMPVINNVTTRQEPTVVRSNAHEQTTVISAIVPMPGKQKIDNDIAVATAPAPALPRPMEVIHINDLERASTPAKARLVSNTDAVDVSKVPTVFINDVEREEVQEKTILRENRMTLKERFSPQPAYNTDAPDDKAQYHIPFKSIHNQQN